MDSVTIAMSAVILMGIVFIALIKYEEKHSKHTHR